MPIYEYACDACGHQLETIQKISDPVLADCPECGKPKLRKLISAAGFRLKGGGWYETDFKAGKKKNLDSPDSKQPVEKVVKSASKEKATKTDSNKKEK